MNKHNTRPAEVDSIATSPYDKMQTEQEAANGNVASIF